MEIEWGQLPRIHDAGIDHGVLYFDNSAVPWNGLTRVTESDSTEVLVDQYFDGVRSVIVQNLGEYSASVEAFTYPDELDSHDRFGFSYRVPQNEGYKIHLVYNALFRPSGMTYASLADEFEAMNPTWDLHATPISVPGSNPVSHLVLDSTEYPDVTEQLENIIYGTSTTNPRLPTPQEAIDICESVATLLIHHNGDGTVTVSGPAEMIQVGVDGTVVLSSPTLFPLNDNEVVVSSY